MRIPVGRCLRVSSAGLLKSAVILSIAVLLCPASSGFAAEPDKATSGVQLTELSLEELMNIEVSSVSRKPEKMSEAAAAVFVITQEDIRRSGVTSIPEALRMAPGVQVARISSNIWAITARGFNSRFSNKLLVLIDGRSVYTPLFSGVYWDVQDVMLEDIDRIEVIRGAGSTMWGANAVNGVINIITKGAQETQGGLVTSGAGNVEKGFGAARYGGKIGEDTYFRVYAKYFERDHFFSSSDTGASDDWRMGRSGFRIDSRPYGEDSFTLQGDIYGGSAGQTVWLADLNPPFSRTVVGDAHVAGGNVLGRWKHLFSETSTMSLQLYYDRTERTEPIGSEKRNTFDLDFQHSFLLDRIHNVIWGLGYRYTQDRLGSTFNVTLDPDHMSNSLFSAFVQDDIVLIQDRLRFILGSKLEHNDFSGFEVEPNARLLWTPNRQYSVWTSVSRAVRTPSRAESDGRVNIGVIPSVFPGAPVSIVSLMGNSELKSEKVIEYEAGIRNSLAEGLYVDMAAFYNVYRNIGFFEAGTPVLETYPQPAHILIPLTDRNILKARSYGVELSADWRAAKWWKLQLAYSILEMKIDTDGISGTNSTPSGSSPHNQISLRSSMDVGKKVELDLWFRYVDKLIDTPAYATTDMRIGWNPAKNLELSLVGQNLLDNHHPEFSSDFTGVEATEVGRSFYGKVTCRF